MRKKLSASPAYCNPLYSGSLTSDQNSARDECSFTCLPRNKWPVLTLFIDSTRGTEDTETVRRILKSLKWYDLVIEVDIHEYPDRQQYIASIVETPVTPFFFFHGKSIGGKEQLERLLGENRGRTGFKKLRDMYIDWAKSNFSYQIGSEFGFHLSVDKMLYNVDCSHTVERKPADISLSNSVIMPKLKLRNRTLDLIRILSDLLVHFSFNHVYSHEVDTHLHRRCFKGRVLSNFIKTTYRITDADSFQICQMLFDFLVVHQVERRDLCLFQDSNNLYRFYTHDNPMILNRLMCHPRRRTDGFVDPMEMLQSLHTQLAKLYNICITNYDEDNPQIDIRDAFYNRDFIMLRVASCELQNITTLIGTKNCPVHVATPYGLGKPQTELQEKLFYISPSGHPTYFDTHRGYHLEGSSVPTGCVCPLVTKEYEQRYIKAFLINLFNLGIQQAFIQVGVPAPNPNRLPISFYMKVSYTFGCADLSLAQIQYNCLKCKFKWDSRTELDPLPKDWPWMLDEPDPRIIFALQDCQNLVPHNLFFRPETINEELTRYTQLFVNDCRNVAVDIPPALYEVLGLTENAWVLETQKLFRNRSASCTMGDRITMMLSCVFEFYGSDFGKNKLEMVTFITTYLKGEKKQIMKRLLQFHNDRKISLAIKFFPVAYHSNNTHRLVSGGRFPFTEELRRT